jgi:uncharacterized membrane protein
MRGLEKRLKLWQEKEILSAEQVQRIREFENSQSRGSWIAFGAAGIGVIALMTGVISTIAANWDGIEDSTKIQIYFVIQALLGLGIWKNRERDGLTRELFITIFSLFVLAGIGLFGQVYHLESDGWQGVRTWLILTLPVVLLARSRQANQLWFLGFASAMMMWLVSTPRFFGAADSPEFYLFRLYFSIMVAYAVLAFGLLRLPWISSWFMDAARLWGFFFVLFPITTFANFLWCQPYHSWELAAPMYMLYPWLGAGLCLGALYLPVLMGKPKEGWQPWVAGVVVASCAAVTLPLYLGVHNQDFLGFIFYMLVWCCAAAAAAHHERKRLFDLATLMISIRLIVIYFELFGTLAATGIGLIITGGVIIGIVMAWNKFRRTHTLQARTNA